MSEELDKLLAEKDQPASEAKPSKTEAKTQDDPVKKEEERLANVRKAIEEANAELRKVRKETKDVKSQPVEEELPKIDLSDPNSKAWDKHFNEKVNPVKDEMAKEKEEIRTFALQKFLADKPNLARDPEKIKRVINTYERIRTASERTTEGVLIDLKKAYAAEFADDILQERQQDRISRAQGDAIFSDPAVSRGSTSYQTEKEKAPHYDRESVAILAKWGMTPEEHAKLVLSQKKNE